MYEFLWVCRTGQGFRLRRYYRTTRLLQQFWWRKWKAGASGLVVLPRRCLLLESRKVRE
jgi:hypothetical protein